jgi:hypothetical protein
MRLGVQLILTQRSSILFGRWQRKLDSVSGTGVAADFWLVLVSGGGGEPGARTISVG